MLDWYVIIIYLIIHLILLTLILSHLKIKIFSIYLLYIFSIFLYIFNIFSKLDPFSMQAAKAKEAIGNALKSQYSRWQPRARYKQCLDPTVEDVRKTLTNLRRSAKRERILFHYNGHGVPKPTSSLEIWVFNRTYTQYIPLSLYDLMDWIRKPALYVFDCNQAAILKSALIDPSRNEGESPEDLLNPDSTIQNIVLAACQANEMLPMNPNLPADLFTACLTTPIKMALQFFVHNNKLLADIDPEMIENFPGKLQERKTPLGELNWIFTAVTDTIAWSVLPRQLFHKLFRQDLLVACLFRNFLLADRIMRNYGCTPYSYPTLPETFNHPMWEAWDLAVDNCVSQLQNVKEDPESYIFSDFFTLQLTDFEVWLRYGYNTHKAPKQLPILLQVLLSQAHRLKALELLSEFLDMGEWAVDMALSVGIFPYVLKLLQSTSSQLKRILVFIWTRIVALDERVLEDLLKENGHCYFIDIIVDHRVNDSVLCAQACFVLANLLDKFPIDELQRVQVSGFLNHLQDLLVCSFESDDHAELSLWICLTIAKLVKNNLNLQTRAFSTNLQSNVIPFLKHRVPEVRTAAIYCLTHMIDDKSFPEGVIEISSALYKSAFDGSVLVRQELVHALLKVCSIYYDKIPPKYFQKLLDEIYSTKRKRDEEENISNLEKMVLAVMDMTGILAVLALDPVPKVSKLARNAFEVLRLKLFPNSDFLTPPKSPQRKFAFMRRQTSERLSSKLGDEDLLRSTFFQWCKRIFVKSKSARVPRPAKKTREIQQTLDLLARQSDSARSNFQPNRTQQKLLDQICSFNTNSETYSLVKFHPFDKTILGIDEGDQVHVWDWTKQKHVISFSTSPQLQCKKISDFCFVNERFDPLLLCVTGTNGNSCFFRNYASKTKKPRVVAGFRAAPKSAKYQESYVISQWQPLSKHMIYGGNYPEINVWDLHREICDVNIDLSPYLVDSNGLAGITSLCNVSIKENQENLFACGSQDGSILICDSRQSKPVIEWKNVHKDCILNVSTQRTNSNILVSADYSGQVHLYDVRKQSGSFNSFQTGKITAFAMHNVHDIIAVGSNDQFIKFYNLNGLELNTILYYDGFFVQRIGPIAALAFHPYKLVLGSSSTDRLLSVYHRLGM